jgi:hypothetical protein
MVESGKVKPECEGIGEGFADDMSVEEAVSGPITFSS